MDVRLPDGTIIQNVPEGTTRTQLIELLRRNEYDVSSLTPPSERTLGGYTKEAFKGLIPGFVGLGETAITGAASLLPERAEQAVRKPVEEFATGVRETFAPAPGYEDTLVRKISEGVGSTAPFLGLGLLGAAGKIGAAGLSVSTGAGEARQKAEEAGATEGQRGVATALGTIPGALEALPPIRILRRFGFGDEAIKEVAGLAPALGRIAKSGGEEALQEASSQVLQNLIAKGVYAPDEAVFGGVGEAATVGGGAGAVISAIAELALGRRLRSSEAAGQEASPETQEETTEEAPPTEPPAPVAAEPAVEEVKETQREATERRARELRVSTREEADLRARETGLRAREETNLRAREEARRRPIGDEDQMGLPLEGGFAQPDLFAEPSEPISGMYRPAEEVLGEQGLKPRSRAFKAEAKDLGLRLDRKGNLKPNQFVPEVTAKPSPDQESFEFEYQQQLPLTLPSELEGQGDLFAQEPIPPGSTVPFARQQPVAETPAVEVPKEQFALDLPGIPMERLVPRDRVLRAMAITEDKKNIPNLRFATGLRPMELQKTIGDLKKEGAIAFNKKENEWELTPAGTERVQTPVELPAAPPTTPPAASAKTATLSPVPPAETVTPITPSEAPRGTEPVTSEIVGGAGAGSTELPVSRVPARGQGPAGAGVEGLGVPNVPAKRVDGREEAAKPALKKVRYKEEGESYDQGISFYYGGRYFSLSAAMGMFSRPILNVTSKNGNRIGDHYANNERQQVDARVGDASQIGQYNLPPDITNAINDYLFSYSKGKEAVKAAGRKIADSINSEMAKYEPAKRVDGREEAAKPALTAPPTPSKSTTHPEWATTFESDVGGEVVYSDADTALVRGSSVISGQSVYIAVDRKTSSRTNIDIESYTGSMFSPEQKQRLVQAKQQIITEDKAKFDANPDGPFTEATSNVVASDGVNPNYANFLSSLMGSMGLGDIRVFLFHPKDVVNKDKYRLYGPYSSALSAGLDYREDGSLRLYGPNLKDFYISVKPGMSEGRTIEVITHELGHLIERVTFNNASPETQAAIRADHDKWLKENKGKQGSDLVRALRNRETAEAHAEGKTSDTKLDDYYWRSFGEWFADNVSKWTTTSEKPVGIVEKFFSDLAKKLRELVVKLTGNRFVPAKSVKDFLDAMGPGSAKSWIQDKTVTTSAARYSMAAPTTPRQVVQGVQNALNSVTQSIIDRPNYTDSYGQKIIDWIGNLPLSKRKIQFALYTLSQMKQLLSTIMPGVAFVEKVNGRRAAQTSQELDHVAKNQSKYKNIIARYPKAKWEKLKEVAKLGTLYQVDPTDPSVKQLHNDVSGRIKNVESLTPVEKVQYEIAAMYYSLPTDLRGILISDDGKSGIVPEYRKYRRQKFEAMIRNWIKQKMPSSEIAELRRQFNDPKNNLSFYIPLRRDQGVYWLTYFDRNNNEVPKLFSNPIERAVFRRQIEAQGVTKILESSRYSDIKGEDRGKPPTGFLGEIVAMLKSSIPEDRDPKKNKAKNDLISEVYDIFLDYMPQNTLRQELSSREVSDLGDGVKQFGKFGFNEDFLETYVKETPRIIYQLNNLRWVLPIEDAMRKLGEQREKYNNERNNAAFMRGRLDMPPEQVNEAFDSIRKRVDFGYSPTYEPWVYQIATGNYIFSIAANISSGLINTTVIPMLAIPILAAKYGVTPTLRAITRASAMFVKAPKEGGFKALGVRIGDFSIANGATGEYEQFFKKLVSRGVIGAASEQELLLAQRLEITGYDSLGDKVNYLAGYVMKNTERFNRETTLLASFMLAREKGKNFTDAFEEAINDNSDVNGASLPASDSRLYQTGLGRVLLTFRKYILNAAILIAGTFKEAVARIEPNNQKQKLLRTVARRRLLGIYAGSYMVSGIGGMPLFGAAEMLAAFMMGDDDEPYDLQQEVMESLGELGLNGPVNALFNLDVASRAGFTDVLWRDDPKRLAEVGYITFGLEKLAGPTYSNFMNFGRAFEEMSEGRIWRGTEAFLPAAARNALKALRYAIEGARTKNGVPIKEDIEKWNLAMQVFGFAPADLATTQARVGAEFEISKKLRQRRTALYTQLYAAVSAGNSDAVRDVYNSIAAYNKANPAIAIDFEGIERSFTQRDRRNAESIDGLYLEKNFRQATIPYVSSRD